MEVMQEEDGSLVGAMIWNLGYTRGGYVNVAVDWLTGVSDRSSKEWLESTSDADEMPDIEGRKLIYIPMPNRGLTTDELSRLRAFNNAGGIVFVTGEHSAYSLERQSANDIMEFLGSPLRCVDVEATYLGDSPYLYPAEFQDINLLFGLASCEVTGGTPISFIPNSTFTPGTNVVWIAYDENSRTVLSGDIEWAVDISPSSNAAFAQALMEVQW
jgi:hypothetical protein